MKQKLLKLIPASLLATIFPLAVKADEGWTLGQSDAGLHKLPEGTISEIVFNLASWLLILLGSVAVIGFVISGILYLTASGDEERMEKAKKGMIYSVIGVIVGLLGFVVVKAIDTWLGGSDAQF